MLEDVLAEVKKRVDQDKTILVDAMAADIRQTLLQQLGFTTEFKQIGRPDSGHGVTILPTTVDDEEGTAGPSPGRFRLTPKRPPHRTD